LRHRKVKNLKERIEATSCFLIENPKSHKGKWREYFSYQNSCEKKERLYMELGCGKGKFINMRAAADLEANFIGIEGLDAVMIRGLERASETDIANLRFIMEYVIDIRDFFDDNELDGIYLNFSDPWPKPRHTKRRFTYGETLLRYGQILKPGGFVAFKTDNEELFEFTLEEIERMGLTIEELSRDLHASSYTAKDFTTEYEEKFRSKGKNINYVLIRF